MYIKPDSFIARARAQNQNQFDLEISILAEMRGRMIYSYEPGFKLIIHTDNQSENYTRRSIKQITLFK